MRTASLSATNEPSWDAWERRTYAMQADVDTLQTTVRWHHAQAKRKHRTTVHYCSSRMKFAMPKVGTTVLIDDCKPHFWGFASFGRPKRYVTKTQLRENPSNANLYENVVTITAEKTTINARECYKYEPESRLAIPDWVWNYWQRTDLDGIDTNIYPRLKPFDDCDPSFKVWNDVEDDGVLGDLANATGSTGLALKSATEFDITSFEDANKNNVIFIATNLASPVVDLCARLTLNNLVVSTPETTTPHTAYYATGDIVRFDGTQWQRIDRLTTGRSVRVLYQKIEVERTGESAFCYRRQRITLPEFQSFQFQYSSASHNDVMNTVAAPADVLNAYLQYVAQRSGSPAFYQDSETDRTLPRVGTLAIFTKVRTGGSKTGTYATVWHRCLPTAGFDTGKKVYDSKNKKLNAHHLLVPNMREDDFTRKYPWYVDAYIAVVRPVAKFNRMKVMDADGNFTAIVQHKPYHRNIEISNRIPVRIMYIRKEQDDGTYTTIVRVRQFARS